MKVRRFVALLFATAILISFAACNKNSTEEARFTTDNVDTSFEDKKTEIQIERKNDNTSLKTEETEIPTESKNITNGTIEELNNTVSKDVEDTIAELNEEYEQLKAEINTFDKYLANNNKVESFYTKIYETQNALCIRMRKYSIQYVEIIIASGKSNDEKYDELEELLNNVYDDAGKDIIDEIYDGVLDDMHDDFYDGIIDDAHDTVDYDVWSDARSDEYDRWSDARSDVYNNWSDYRSDVYNFWSDVRGEIWDDDIKSAEKKIEDFRKDIEK